MRTLEINARRLLVAMATVLAFVASMLFTPAQAEESNNEETLGATPDSYKLFAGYHRIGLEVFLNDEVWKGDHPNAHISHVRHEAFGDDSKAKVNSNHEIELRIDQTRTKSLSFEYKWTDSESGAESAWTSVDITVKPSYLVRATQPAKLKIKLYNPNKVRVHCELGSSLEDHPDFYRWIKPGSSVVATNKHRHSKMYLKCFIGNDWSVSLNNDRLKNLKV